ncbi:spore coat protein YsxE [Bacillus kwashiorkori]|uniref:spore coat protein YsxE n=1 Tax=Bacillus kwashiorkori TaxID=1522318 RepID=UPI0007814747|nr:spore coat protein YsxE [Bacillus kwashiorkori]
MEKGYPEWLLSILKEYNIRPRYVEQHGKVYKIFSKDDIYALKEMNGMRGVHFFQQLPFLYKRGFHRFVPVYPTKTGNYSVIMNNRVYYLMPWVESALRDDSEQSKQMMRELAKLHTLTTKDITVTKEAVEENLERINQQWKRELTLLEEWVERCENKVYMSPFEWEFVQYYFEVKKALEYAVRTINLWGEQAKENDKARTTFIHGKIAPNHFLLNEKGYGFFINLENSRYASPIHDLLPYLSNRLRTHPKHCNETIELLFTYLKYNPLRKEEMLLLKSYLAYPGDFLQIVRQYDRKKIINHELRMTNRLQKRFWHIKNIEYIIMKLEEIEHAQENAQT